jgi:hypothetical protein
VLTRLRDALDVLLGRKVVADRAITVVQNITVLSGDPAVVAQRAAAAIREMAQRVCPGPPN